MSAPIRLATLACLLIAAGCAGPTLDVSSNSRALDLRLTDDTLSAGAPKTALGVADRMLRRDPHDVDALLRRGQALMLLSRPADAAQSLAQAAALKPRSLVILGLLAQARAAQGDAADAERAWRSALALAPGDDRLQTGLAIALDMQERHDQAQVLYRAVLARTPDDAAVRSDLGLSLALSGRASEGVELLRQAAQGDEGAPQEIRARHNLAAGLVLAGQDQEAAGVLRQDMPPADVTAAMAGLRQLAAR